MLLLLLVVQAAATCCGSIYPESSIILSSDARDAFMLRCLVVCQKEDELRTNVHFVNDTVCVRACVSVCVSMCVCIGVRV
jgi:hypothetical protein